jgi:RNA polymerase sigma factor (sigma-70 family)
VTVETAGASSSTELVQRIAAGDSAAEAQLFHQFAARVRFLARRELRSPAGVDDVCSETMMRTILALRQGKLREPEALPGFVLQTAKNVVREQNRKGDRTVSFDEPDIHLPEPSAPEPDPDADPRVVQALRQAAVGLGARDRAFLKFEYYDELPRGEIARRLGISEDRVRLIRSRALKRFRDAFDAIVRAGDTSGRQATQEK